MTTAKKNKRTFYSWIIGIARPYWFNITGILMLSLLIVGFQLLEPWPLKVLVDSVFGSVAPPYLLSHLSAISLLVISSVSIILIYGLQSLLAMFKVYYVHKTIFRLDLQLARAYFDKLLHLAPRFVDKQRTGDYAYRLNAETGEVSTLIINVSTQMLHGIVMVAGILVIMATFDYQLALLALVMLPFLLKSIRYFTPKIEHHSVFVERNNSLLYSYTTEAIDNLSLIQGFSRQASSAAFFKRLLIKNFARQMRYIIVEEKFTLINDIISTVTMAILVVLGALKVYHHQLTIGELLIFLSYLSYLYEPLELISSSIGQAKANLAATRRVFGLFRVDYSVKEIPGARTLPRAIGAVDCRNVNFQYGPHHVLTDFSLVIRPGEKVAITGPSGAGKTSLLGLLERFYDVTSGTIHIDGVDIRTVTLESLRDQFSIVSQDTPLLATTIAKNIAFAVDRVPTDAELQRVAAAADALDFIEALPQGFKTQVGEHGNKLSGGQRQRIAIARAFLKDSPILLLDEPTSALDEAAERQVMRALTRLMKDKTVIVVTHSAAILEHVDRVYWLEDGRLGPYSHEHAHAASVSI